MATWRSKRPQDAYVLSVTNAFFWHRECTCQRVKPAGWRQISGKGEEGTWASAWLQWLWRTHLEPRGLKMVGESGGRTIDLMVDEDGVPALKDAIAAGPLEDEAAPDPPFDPAKSPRPH
jgi:hypothetical protein